MKGCLRFLLTFFFLMISSDAHSSSLSFSSSYAYKANSNRAIGEFMVEVIDAYGFLYTGLEKALDLEVGPATYFYDFFFKGGFDFIFGWGLNSLLSDQITTPYHEFGHFSRAASVGLSPNFEDKYQGFFPYFLGYMKNITSKKSKIQSFTNPGGNIENLSQRFLLQAGGINNETYMGELISEKAYLHGIHSSSFLTYIMTKTAILSYVNADANTSDDSSNDIKLMIQSYSELGKNSITIEDFKIASKVAMAASGSMYAYMWSLYKMLSDRSYKMRPFEIFGIRIPDTSAYLMPQGISYKITSGYRYDDTLAFPISCEFIQKGDTAYEVTLGIYKQFPEYSHLTLKGDILISHSMEIGGKIYAEFQPFDSIYVGMGVESYNSKTLYGARNIPHQEQGETRSNEFWIQAGLRY